MPVYDEMKYRKIFPNSPELVLALYSTIIPRFDYKEYCILELHIQSLGFYDIQSSSMVVLIMRYKTARMLF